MEGKVDQPYSFAIRGTVVSVFHSSGDYEKKKPKLWSISSLPTCHTLKNRCIGSCAKITWSICNLHLAKVKTELNCRSCSSQVNVCRLESFKWLKMTSIKPIAASVL